MYIHRTMEQKVRELARHFPVVLVCGARQVGKTTLLKSIAEESGKIQYVTLDYPRLRQLAKEDPELFLQQYDTPLIIDEIQYAPELLTCIKIRVDENPQKGQYYLTGSQMFHTMKAVSESLAGRVGILSMYSLTRAEIEKRECVPFHPAHIVAPPKTDTLTQVFDRIIKGGMPGVIAGKGVSLEDFYGSYVQTYLERDIRDLTGVKDMVGFERFISCAAARSGQEVNLADMAKDVGIDAKTAESWLSILVASGIAILLRPYFGNTIKRIVKRPKLYFMDTGLACYLSLWNNAKALSVSAMAGAMFETYVVSEIIKGYENNGIDTRSRFVYYRDNNGKEIDLMLIENGVIYPMEIKKNADPGAEALKNFTVLDALTETRGQGAVLCLADMVVPLDRENLVVPIACI